MNEVPLNSTQFASARGLHQFAKEAINRAYFDMIQEFKWPWMQIGDNSLGELQDSGERTVVPTSTWTQLPVANPYKDVIDWSTIYYRDGDDNKLYLQYLEWEDFEDFQDTIERMPDPAYIVQSADGRSMGLIPFPDTNIGKIYYRIWTRPSRFSLATDEIPMPDIHFQTLVDGALHHMWTFRGDAEASALAYQRWEKGLRKMKQKYTNQSTRARWV